MAGPYTYFLLGDGRNLKQIAIKLDGKARLGAVWCNVLATVLEGEISKTTHAWKSLILCYINESSFFVFYTFFTYEYNSNNSRDLFNKDSCL